MWIKSLNFNKFVWHYRVLLFISLCGYSWISTEPKAQINGLAILFFLLIIGGIFFGFAKKHIPQSLLRNLLFDILSLSGIIYFSGGWDSYFGIGWLPLITLYSFFLTWYWTAITALLGLISIGMSLVLTTVEWDGKEVSYIFISLFTQLTYLVTLLAQFYKNELQEKENLNLSYNSITELTKALRTTTKLDQVLNQILEIIILYLGYDRAFIYLVDHENGKEMLRFKTGIGVNANVLKAKKYVINRQIGIKTKIGADGILPRALEKQRVINIRNARNHYECDQDLVEKLDLENFIVLPLQIHNKNLGVLVLDHYRTKKEITETEEKTLTVFANNATIAIDNARLYEDIERLTVLDGLTEVYNHRHMQTAVKKELEQAKRYSRFLSFMMLDIDHFKQYNDHFGHPQGDVVLKDISKILKDNTRSGDMVARYGGEEFLILLQETYKEDAAVVAEKIRSRIAQHEITEARGEEDRHVTVSIGISSFPDDGSSKEELIEAADKMLYRSKHDGRNRISYETKTKLDSPSHV